MRTLDEIWNDIHTLQVRLRMVPTPTITSSPDDYTAWRETVGSTFRELTVLWRELQEAASNSWSDLSGRPLPPWVHGAIAAAKIGAVKQNQEWINATDHG